MNFLVKLGVLCLFLAFISIFIGGLIGWLIYGIAFVLMLILWVIDTKFEFASRDKSEEVGK